MKIILGASWGGVLSACSGVVFWLWTNSKKYESKYESADATAFVKLLVDLTAVQKKKQKTSLQIYNVCLSENVFENTTNIVTLAATDWYICTHYISK